MGTYIARRLGQAALVMAVMSVIVFSGVYAIGDPVELLVNPLASPAEREATTRALGLDQPLWRQYLLFLMNALRGDLGSSFVFNEPALRLILNRMPATLELAVGAMFLSLLVGIPLGLYAGLRANSKASTSIMLGSIVGFSLPTFWVGLMLIFLFSVHLGWLPSTGRGQTATVLGMAWSFLTWDGLKHLLMPMLTLSLFKISVVIRLTAAGAREAVSLDYVKFARAKGLRRRRIVGVHILKNILIPVVTVSGLELGSTIAFAVVTESIFGWPGMGKLMIDSINLLDRPVVVSYLMLMVLIFVVINLIVDFAYTVLDPRVRLEPGQ